MCWALEWLVFSILVISTLFYFGAGRGGFIAVQSLVHMQQPTKTVNVGCLATAFKECYLLSKRQAVISFLLKQKHKRRKKMGLRKKKRKRVITSPANSVNGSIIRTHWWYARSSLLPPYDFQQRTCSKEVVFCKKCSQVELTSHTNSEKINYMQDNVSHGGKKKKELLETKVKPAQNFLF